MTGQTRFSHLLCLIMANILRLTILQQTAEQLSDTTRRIQDDENTSIQVDVEAGTKEWSMRRAPTRSLYAHGVNGGIAHEEEAKR